MAKLYHRSIELANTLGKHVTLADSGLEVDRIICDIPSFADRWTGSGGAGTILDCVNSVIHLIKSNLSEDGTATVSLTGDALDRFDLWLAGQSDFEVVPGSEFTVYKPLYRDKRYNKHLWTRTDNWAYAKTIRRVGSNYTVSWSKWLGIENVHNGGNQFPMPASRDDYTTSAFRLGVHQGILESREYQNWLAENNIAYNEAPVSEGNDNMTIQGVVDPGEIMQDGWIIAPSDFALFTHVPKRLYPMDNLTSNLISEFQNNEHTKRIVEETYDVNQIQLMNYIYTTHCGTGDIILDPFCSTGSGLLASVITNNSYIGWEENFDRGRTAQLASLVL